LEKLREKKLPLLDLNNPTLTSVADISSTVGDLKKTSERGGNGPAVRRLRKVLKTVGSYARIVDRSIQHNPAITALVWAGVRAILQVRQRSFINSKEISISYINCNTRML